MRKDIIIRRETEDDRPRVEEIVRRAFYNLYIPGAAEHYLVHIMRSHPDFIQELDLVLELEGQVIGAIMYTMLVKELVPGSLDGRKWVYRQSPVFEFSEEEALAYDDTLEPLEKKELPCQEEFYILSSAMLPE